MAWFDGMPAEDLTYVQGKGWDKLDDSSAAKAVLTSYRNLEKLHGAPADKIIRLPDTLDDTTVRPILTKLGVPETADKYDFSSLKGADGKELPAERLTELRGLAASGAMTQGAALKFAQDWLKWQGDYTAGQTAAQKQAAEAAAAEAATKATGARTANMGALQNEWGVNYDVNYLAAERMAGMCGFASEHLEAMKGTQQYVTFMRQMHAMVQAGGESPLIGGRGAADGGKGIPDEAALTKEKEEIFNTWKGKMIPPDKASEVFARTAEIDRLLVLHRHQRRT